MRLDIRKVHSKPNKQINIRKSDSIVTLVLNATCMRIKVAEKFRANSYFKQNE